MLHINGILTNAEVLGARLEEGVLLGLAGLAGEGSSSRLLSGLGGLRLVIETSISDMLSSWGAIVMSVYSELYRPHPNSSR